MRAIHEEPSLIDRLDHLAAERRQRDIAAVAAAGDRVVAVIGEMDLTDAEIAIEPDHRRIVLEHDRAFEVEGDGELALAYGALDIGERPSEQETVVMRGEPGAETRDAAHHMRERVHVHPDIERDEADAGGAMPLERLHRMAGYQRQAGMRVPDEALRMDGPRTLRNVPIHRFPLPLRASTHKRRSQMQF